jgi:hypothetical protein
MYVSNAQTASDTVTNKTVLELKAAGLSADNIKSKISSSPCKFDLSKDNLIALKKAGISDDVISAMFSKGNAANSGKPNQNSSPQGSSGSKVDPGIYYSKNGKDSSPVKLEPSVFSQSKRGANFFPEFGQKTKMTSAINGANSNLQINENKPVFLIYFASAPYNGGNFSANWIGSATSPTEFILIRFKIVKNSREVVTGSYGTYQGFSSGIDVKDQVSFKSEKIAEGQYRIYFDEPLQTGEYGFMYGGGGTRTTAFQKVFDFGIK